MSAETRLAAVTGLLACAALVASVATTGVAAVLFAVAAAVLFAICAAAVNFQFSAAAGAVVFVAGLAASTGVVLLVQPATPQVVTREVNVRGPGISTPPPTSLPRPEIPDGSDVDPSSSPDPAALEKYRCAATRDLTGASQHTGRLRAEPRELDLDALPSEPRSLQQMYTSGIFGGSEPGTTTTYTATGRFVSVTTLPVGRPGNEDIAEAIMGTSLCVTVPDGFEVAPLPPGPGGAWGTVTAPVGSTVQGAQATGQAMLTWTDAETLVVVLAGGENAGELAADALDAYVTQ
jgi:hypothetical protein